LPITADRNHDGDQHYEDKSWADLHIALQR